MVGFMGVFFHDWLQGVKNLASLPCGLLFLVKNEKRKVKNVTITINH